MRWMWLIPQVVIWGMVLLTICWAAAELFRPPPTDPE